jgi:CPA2 family monovalent cation:H+ antiporter-2
MFTLGLEFNLAKLRSMRQHVFVLGALQVGSTMILSVLMLMVLPAWMITRLLPAEADWKTGFVIGAALAMSSTALITKLLAERRELESEHGRRAFGVLLFQDLAVIPLLVVIPALGAGIATERPFLRPTQSCNFAFHLASHRTICHAPLVSHGGEATISRTFHC